MLGSAGCLLTAENLLNLGRVEKRTLFQAPDLAFLPISGKLSTLSGTARRKGQIVLVERRITVAGWWFQRLFIFTLTWGNDPV